MRNKKNINYNSLNKFYFWVYFYQNLHYFLEFYKRIKTKSNNFNLFFINACIYTSNLNKYESIQKKHSDFIGKICIDTNSLVNFIKDNFLKINVYNEKFNINTLININSYKSEYIYLHKEISKYYANESIHIFNNNLILAEDFIKKQNLKDEEKNSIVSNS